MSESGSHSCSWIDKAGSYQKWNVFRLWKAAEGLPVVEVELSLYGWLKHLPDVNHPEVAVEMTRIAESDLSYPILVHPEGWVMDGKHRTAKAYLAGNPTIRAVLFTGASLPLPDTEIPDYRKA
jgi:hypothetical protein